jgi:hypothetical protein
MDDLVHELASVIIADEFHVLDADDTIPRNWKGAVHCRHTQLTKYQKQTDVFKDLPGKLRSLHFRNSQDLQLPKKAFSRYKYMRVLNLSAAGNIGDSVRLPSSIHKLKLLRYFDATGLPMASLPKSFPKLENMQTLIMSSCSLKACQIIYVASTNFVIWTYPRIKALVSYLTHWVSSLNSLSSTYWGVPSSKNCLNPSAS